jgi:hypothetical protein
VRTLPRRTEAFFIPRCAVRARKTSSMLEEGVTPPKHTLSHLRWRPQVEDVGVVIRSTQQSRKGLKACQIECARSFACPGRFRVSSQMTQARPRLGGESKQYIRSPLHNRSNSGMEWPVCQPKDGVQEA